MAFEKKIKSALISVYHKDKLDEIVHKLVEFGVKFYSTGGTKDFLESIGAKVTAVEDITGYPSILGGRVKTLHPKVFGGILSRRDKEEDNAHLKQYDIPEIDLVIVDLYPFEKTVASDASENDIIEKIDIGGISLIRAAAKNYKDVVIIPSVNQYAAFEEILANQGAATTEEQRKMFASHAFLVSSHYDTAIFNYFNQDTQIPVFKQSVLESQTLRYGENPHQKGWFYGDFSAMFTQLNGKELSYNIQ